MPGPPARPPGRRRLRSRDRTQSRHRRHGAARLARGRLRPVRPPFGGAPRAGRARRGAPPARQGARRLPTGRRGPAGPRRPDHGRPAEDRPARRPAGRRARREPSAARAPGRLAVVYDIDGPRRLGVGWFLLALVGVFLGPITTALVYGAAAGWAAFQVVRAWGSVAWQADVAAGLGAVPVLAALGGTRRSSPHWRRGPGSHRGGVRPRRSAWRAGAGAPPSGHLVARAIVPAAGAASMVLVRGDSLAAAVVLLLLVSAYEMGDFVVGSGASNPVEGPLAGITAGLLVGVPLALLLVNPFDDAGAACSVCAAAACPLGRSLRPAAPGRRCLGARPSAHRHAPGARPALGRGGGRVLRPPCP